MTAAPPPPMRAAMIAGWLGICAAGCRFNPPPSAGPDAASCDPGAALLGGACVAQPCSALTCGTVVDDLGQPFECGSCAPGIGCSADHQCQIADDGFEPNDDPAAAFDLGAWNDNPARAVEYGPLVIATGDEDWLRLRIIDVGDGADPAVTVSLLSATSVHEVSLWFRCDAADVGTRLACGSQARTLVDSALGVGCTTSVATEVTLHLAVDCAGSVDNGTALIRVHKLDAPRGDGYRLRVAIQ